MQFEPKDWVNPDGFGFFRVFSGQGLEDHFNIGSGWVQTLQKSLGYFNLGYREKETFGFFRVFFGLKSGKPNLFFAITFYFLHTNIQKMWVKMSYLKKTF